MNEYTKKLMEWVRDNVSLQDSLALAIVLMQAKDQDKDHPHNIQMVRQFLAKIEID